MHYLHVLKTDSDCLNEKTLHHQITLTSGVNRLLLSYQMENAFVCSPKASIIFPLHAFGPNYSKQLFIRVEGKAAQLSSKSPLLPSSRILNACGGPQVRFSQSSTLPLQI